MTVASARPTRRRTSKGLTPSSTKCLKSSAQAPRSVRDRRVARLARAGRGEGHGPKDRLKFVFSPALTQEELDQVALIKSADDGDFDHRNTEADSLAIAKVLKKGKIDARTVDLINAGFTFASRLFSLSPNARDNWIALYAGKAALTYPITVTAQDGDGRFSIPDAATLEGIYLTGIGVVGALLAAGRDLKDDIDELTTIAAVEAFEDPR